MKRLFYLMRILALLALAGATLFAGCSKDKDNLDPETKTTVYTFGPETMGVLNNLSQIAASADSVQVGKIISQAHNADVLGDSTYAWLGVGLWGVYENALVPAMKAAKGKGECRGTLKRVTDSKSNRECAPKLEALGLKIIFEPKTAAIARR